MTSRPLQLRANSSQGQDSVEPASSHPDSSSPKSSSSPSSCPSASPNSSPLLFEDSYGLSSHPALPGPLIVHDTTTTEDFPESSPGSREIRDLPEQSSSLLEFQGFLEEHLANILLDSGATHNFVASRFLVENRFKSSCSCHPVQCAYGRWHNSCLLPDGGHGTNPDRPFARTPPSLRATSPVT
jgi:hypothetical protein